MIEIKVNEQILPEQLATVFTASGIKRPVDDIERMEQMLQHANLLITAWDGEKLVGVARSLTDYSYCCYLSDLAVDQHVQAKGIGRALIEETKKQIGNNVTLILRASNVAMDYYPKVGFELVDNCYIIQKKA
ncbi:GNAT family N-acetyltransferase [Geomicrobium sediminis]|uniref:Ribosomal protein S18 acetylase RimI-like enzyme n=1 Tax=Geomicrobium sediminis TaxID=1347788 RepID=A0ABS2PCQ5_9BACL|nr:GNAT family N-acetyltransferase [Geomicrobium sediminis]MBM7633210.1 ribosomal protein S18 acetylase RimI-like enzyme [Geomicrobium sediminis]